MVGQVAWGIWREVADGVLVRRHRRLDMNSGLVLGDRRCLVIDTRGSDREGRDLLAAIRDVTSLPFVVVDTHAHFDHCFGNGVFVAESGGCEVWGHLRCRETLLAAGAEHREAMAEWLHRCGDEDYAAEVAEVDVVPPNRTLTTDVTLSLGGREVVLRHPGRGHTDNDVVIDVVGADVTFAGDLVEQGAPPSFDDAFPLEWPDSLAGLVPSLGRVVVPGHGDVVDPEFAARQRDDIAEVADVARGLGADVDDLTLERVANRLAVGGPAGLVGLRRALEHLRACS